jgi:hypothetical protein
VNRLWPLRRAHEYARIAHEQIAALDNFDSHLPRQIGVLEIRAVVSAGVSSTTVGSATPAGAMYFRHFKSSCGIMIHRLDADAFKHSRKRALHRAAVFQDVTDAGRAAAVVFQHQIIAVLVADQVRAANVDVNALRHLKIHELTPEMLSRQNEKLRHDAVLHDFLLVINVVQEKIQRGDALREAALDVLPFIRRDDARQKVEGENFLRPLRVAINIERDALPQKARVHRLPLGVEFRARHVPEKFLQFAVMRPVSALRVHHLIEVKRIGILTAGGDTPALNATIHGAVTRANQLKVEITGLIKGFNSLFNPRVPHVHLNPLFQEIPELDPTKGGTLIGSSRDFVDPNKKEELDLIASRLGKLGIEGLICIGGDGTLNGLQPIAERLPTVLAPKTIDNDLGLNYPSEPDEWVRVNDASAKQGYRYKRAESTPFSNSTRLSITPRRVTPPPFLFPRRASGASAPRPKAIAASPSSKSWGGIPVTSRSARPTDSRTSCSFLKSRWIWSVLSSG